MKLLNTKDSKDRLKNLDNWKISGKKLKRSMTFPEFMDLIKFVNKLAALAEEEGHHPDMSIHYNRLDIEIWTHSVDGLTENDFVLAEKIDALRGK